jgi:hypothetical protein
MEFIRKYGLLIGSIVALLVLICFALLLIPEFQSPTILQNSGLAAIISTFLGVVMTVAITAMLLDKQAETQGKLLKEQSDTDAQKKKEVKIYEQRMETYSQFIEKMWEIVAKNESDNENEPENSAIYDLLEELQQICFKQLIFFLDNKQIEKIAKQIEEIKNDTTPTKAASEITQILQDSLQDSATKNDDEVCYPLVDLYKVFKRPKSSKNNTESEKNIPAATSSNDSIESITYWHFIMLYEDVQIKAFRENNWVLALIEYGEDWRSWFVQQVKPNDVIFLFQKGGAGYIGAFRALDPPSKILKPEEIGDAKYAEYKEYDIYESIPDGATSASNILVEPIAYNFKGIGYPVVRRRTIERMNDLNAVKFLLNRFNGKDLDENRLIGKGTFDDGTPVKLNENYFSGIIRKNNL